MQLKLAILQLLEENRGRDLSGTDLAKRLGVSRNAVWKVMRALQADGYGILSRKNRGYRLASEDDTLSAVGIAGAIQGPVRGLAIYLHKEIDSTNLEARRLIADGKCGLSLIVAEAQSAGRGRQGKSFYSPRKTGIYMTLSIPTRFAMQNAVSLTTAAAVAVFRAIERLCGIKTQIKWVNDLYLHDRKICGILTEGITDLESGLVEHMLVGIGLNYVTTDFPPELQDIATALHPDGVHRNRMIGAIVDELFAVLADPTNPAHMALYRAHSMVLGKAITYTQNGISYTAHAQDIADDGGLVVRLPQGGETILRSGEISLRVEQ